MQPRESGAVRGAVVCGDAQRRSEARTALWTGEPEGGGTEKACAKRVCAGALHVAKVWQARRPTMRLSGVRVVIRAGQLDHVVSSNSGMAYALKTPRLPVSQAGEDQMGELRGEARRWTKKWDFAELGLPSEAEVGHPPQPSRDPTGCPGGRARPVCA